MVSRDFIHHNTDTDRDREAPQTITDRGRRIPENELYRVSHFNPTGIALTAFFHEIIDSHNFASEHECKNKNYREYSIFLPLVCKEL